MVGSGHWLLINTSDESDVFVPQLADALKAGEADVTAMTWRADGDHAANADLLRRGR